MCPASGGRAPDSVRMSVLFPAPLPPTTPTTSPGYRSIVTPSTARTPPNETWMFRSSTSGMRCGLTPVVALGSFVSIAGSPRPSTHGGIQTDRRDEDEADHDVLRRRVNEEQHHARPQRLHHHR